MAPRPAKNKKPKKGPFWKPEKAEPPPNGPKIDLELLEKMSSELCTVDEIASELGCTRDYIYWHHADVLDRGRDRGNASLKRRMHEIAMSGNVNMLIWLSKQRLGMKDKQPEEASNVQFNVTVKEIPD